MENRLNILVENDVVDKDIADYTLNVYKDFIVPKSFDGNASEVFLTHLAMAAQRVRQDNIVSDMDDAILNDIKAFDRFEDVEDYINVILETSVVNFPEAEVKFLWLHMCNIINEKGGK